MQDIEVKLKLEIKQSYLSKSIRHLDVIIDRNLDEKDPPSGIASKLIRGNVVITKLRYYGTIKVLIRKHWHKPTFPSSIHR